MHGPVFETARTEEGFAEVTVDPESGTIVWPGGADLAPDTLYERVRTGVRPDSVTADASQQHGLGDVARARAAPVSALAG